MLYVRAYVIICVCNVYIQLCILYMCIRDRWKDRWPDRVSPSHSAIFFSMTQADCVVSAPELFMFPVDNLNLQTH